ncbi:hypothetical protein EKI60_00750 [Candidatus Saccharibacteria bacterium]|nr:MAG: hypothetical protein EKI60_00750 [Candidatus Saccharibacteria bacterium]
MHIKQKQDGFTIVELLIIIIVIGILAALILTTATDYRQKERNKERQTDIKSLQVGIEGYYAQHGKYPTLSELNDSNWRTKNIKALEPDELKDPSGTGSKLVESPTANSYSYEVKANDDTVCDNNVKDCSKYVLTATFEGGDSFSKNNLN